MAVVRHHAAGVSHQQGFIFRRFTDRHAGGEKLIGQLIALALGALGNGRFLAHRLKTRRRASSFSGFMLRLARSSNVNGAFMGDSFHHGVQR